jgi:hypothetical protein
VQTLNLKFGVSFTLHLAHPLSSVLLLESVSAVGSKLFALTLKVVEVGAETKTTLNPTWYIVIGRHSRRQTKSLLLTIQFAPL